MLRLPFIKNLINDKGKKIFVYFATRSAGEDYDPEELNYTYTNLNPIVIKGYVEDISPEALVWKQYGLKELGAKEIICESKYADWFRKANEIKIDDESYAIFKEGTGNRALIQARPYGLIRVILQKKV